MQEGQQGRHDAKVNGTPEQGDHSAAPIEAGTSVHATNFYTRDTWVPQTSVTALPLLSGTSVDTEHTRTKNERVFFFGCRLVCMDNAARKKHVSNRNRHSALFYFDGSGLMASTFLLCR